MNPLDPRISEENFQASLKEAADSMALEGYVITPEIQKVVEENARRNSTAAYNELDELRRKYIPEKRSAA